MNAQRFGLQMVLFGGRAAPRSPHAAPLLSAQLQPQPRWFIFGATAAFPRFGTGNGPVAKAPSSARGISSSVSRGPGTAGTVQPKPPGFEKTTNNSLSFSWLPTLVPGFLEALGFSSWVRFQPFCNNLSPCPGGQTSSGLFSKSLLSSRPPFPTPVSLILPHSRLCPWQGIGRWLWWPKGVMGSLWFNLASLAGERCHMAPTGTAGM